MESFGERLKSAREAKKLSISDVHKDTNITPMYIEALEEERFQDFPGETYLIGFLRSYAEYLKLDVNSVLESYRGYKIGESDTPVDALIKSTGSSFGGAIYRLFLKYKTPLIVAVIIAALCGVFFGVKKMIGSGVDVTSGASIENIRNEFNASNLGANIDNIKTLQLHNDQGFILVYANEAVQFLVDNKEVVFLLKEIKDNSVVVQIIPGKTTEEIAIDETSVLNIPDLPREVKMSLKGLTEQRAKLLVELGESLAPEAAKNDADFQEDGDRDNTSVVALNKKNLKIVFKASFSEKSFLEIYLDGVQKYRGFVEPGSQERWEANEFIQIKAGNAGGLKAVINGKDYAFGKSGQVVNKMVTWRKDASNPNLYHIVVKDQ